MTYGRKRWVTYTPRDGAQVRLGAGVFVRGV